MPTQRYFDKFPPFPSDVPVAPLPRLSFDKLQKHDVAESEALFDACQSMGFFLIDFRGNAEGEDFLRKAEDMFELTEDVNALDEEHLQQFAYQPRKDLFG